MIEEALPRRRRLHSAGLAVEELHAERCLHLRKMVTEGRGRDAERGRCPGEGAVFYNGGEVAELAGIEHSGIEKAAFETL